MSNYVPESDNNYQDPRNTDQDNVMETIEKWRQNQDPRYARYKNYMMRTRLDVEDALADYNRKFQRYA